MPTALDNGSRRARRLMPDFLAKLLGRRPKERPMTPAHPPSAPRHGRSPISEGSAGIDSAGDDGGT
jgi:hypothetical protein